MSTRTPEQPRFVAGSIGPSGKLPSADDPELSNITFDELADVFREQAHRPDPGRGGPAADRDLAGYPGGQGRHHRHPAGLRTRPASACRIQAQVTLDTTGRMLLGTDIAAALAILEGLPIDVIGLNCSTGPEHMREPIRFLGEHATPAGLLHPQRRPAAQRGWRGGLPAGAGAFAAALVEFVEKNHISVVGGCCGTTPAHLQAAGREAGRRGRTPAPARPPVDAAPGFGHRAPSPMQPGAAARC